MPLYLFLDEAGNFSGNKDNYFVLLAFSTSNPELTRKQFLKARDARLPKKFRKYSEVKFSDKNISEQFKTYVLRQMGQTDIQIYTLIFERRNIPDALVRHPEGLIYRHLVGQLLEFCPIGKADSIFIFFDRRHLKGIQRQDFDAELKAHILPRITKNVRMEIQHVDSTTNVNIQIADFLAGALFQKYERSNPRYYEQISTCIQVEKELFT